MNPISTNNTMTLPNTKKGRILRASYLALAIVAALPSLACAADFVVSNDAELRAAITAANASTDPNSSILLANSFLVSETYLPTSTKPINIDMQGFTLTGSYNPAPGTLDGVIGFINSAPVTLNGIIVGANDPAGLSGQTGLRATSTTVTSFASITGGMGSSGSTSAAGAVLISATLINHGTIKGGASSSRAGSGLGVQVGDNSHLENHGLIEGGDSQGPFGGIGVFVGISPSGTSSLTNYGMVRGGTGVGASGREAVRVGSSASTTVINAGTLEGGNGAAAVAHDGAVTLINSGTIRAGAGHADAITSGTNAQASLTLELQAGYAIKGNVVAAAAGVTDILRLAGTSDATFDVSGIGQTAQYRNFEAYQKTGSSTWTLTGTGTSVTNWSLQQGTLQLGNGGISGSIIGDVANSGTLAFNRSDVMTFSGVISGTGSVRQIGAGTTTLTGVNTYTGGTFVEAGTLAVNGSLCGPLEVLLGGRLHGIGTVCNTNNAGIVAPGNSIGTLTVNGNYAGNGGVLELETELGGDSSPTDRLVVTGDTTGNTIVRVTNVGGQGARTVEGIKVVDVGAASNGAFALQGDYVYQGEQAVVAGAYAYRLQKNGISTPADGDWYLRSSPTGEPPPLYQAGVPVYESYAGMLQTFDVLGTLQQRVSGRSWSGAEAAANGHGVWARVDARNADFEPERSTTTSTYDTSTWKLETGADIAFSDTLVGGLVAHYGEISGDIDSVYGRGSLSSTGYGFGATLTWRTVGGLYIDAQARATRYDSDLRSRTAGLSLVDGNDGDGYAIGVELGRSFALDGAWSLTPQAQLSYASIKLDDFTDAFGAEVRPDDSKSLVGRLGLSVDYRNVSASRRSHFYGIANLYNEFEGDGTVDVSGIAIRSENESLWGGLGAGGSVDLANGRLALYGELTANTGLENFGESTVFAGTVGLRASW